MQMMVLPHTPWCARARARDQDLRNPTDHQYHRDKVWPHLPSADKQEREKKARVISLRWINVCKINPLATFPLRAITTFKKKKICVPQNRNVPTFCVVCSKVQAAQTKRLTSDQRGSMKFPQRLSE